MLFISSLVIVIIAPLRLLFFIFIQSKSPTNFNSIEISGAFLDEVIFMLVNPVPMKGTFPKLH